MKYTPTSALLYGVALLILPIVSLVVPFHLPWIVTVVLIILYGLNLMFGVYVAWKKHELHHYWFLYFMFVSPAVAVALLQYVATATIV